MGAGNSASLVEAQQAYEDKIKSQSQEIDKLREETERLRLDLAVKNATISKLEEAARPPSLKGDDALTPQERRRKLRDSIVPRLVMTTPKVPEVDYVLCATNAGLAIRSILEERLKAEGNTVATLPIYAEFQAKSLNKLEEYGTLVEKKVCGCRYVVGIVTKDAVDELDLVFGLRAGGYYKRRVVLVHDSLSGPFPAARDLPEDLMQHRVFTERPVPFVPDFPERCVQLVVQAVNVKGHPALPDQLAPSDVFLSHRRMTAGGAARHLAMGMSNMIRKNDGYRVFIESEADFEPELLERVIKSCRSFLLLLTDGALDSPFILLETRIAMELKKPIIVVREAGLELPSPLPDSLSDLAPLLAKPQIIYVQDYLPEVVNKIRQAVGPPDGLVKRLSDVFGGPLVASVEAEDAKLTTVEFTMKEFKGNLEEFLFFLAQFHKPAMDRITTYCLRQCSMESVDYTSLFQYFQSMTAGTRVELWSMPLTSKELPALVRALKANCPVAALVLDSNDLWPDGGHAIADALLSNTRLDTLEIRSNKIGKEGAAAIADLLKVNKTITALDIRDNHFGADAVELLCDALRTNSTLTHLDIRSNQIGPRGGAAIAKVLRVNKGLKQLDLLESEIGDEGAFEIAEAIKVNSTLTSLDLFYNGISVAGVSALTRALERNDSIISLDLKCNEVDDVSEATMNKALLRNSTRGDHDI